MPPAGKKRKRAERRSGGGKAAFQSELDRVIAAFADRVTVSSRPRRPPPARPARLLAIGGLPAGMTLSEATRRFQFELVRDALERQRRGGRWNIAATAKTLGVARSFLYRLIEEMERSEPGPRGRTR